MIPLSKPQREILSQFYTLKREKILLNKVERDKLWHQTKKREDIDFESLQLHSPALSHQIRKSYEEGSNIQSAIFSECVYAQALANVFNLTQFHNCFEEKNCIPEGISRLIASYNLVPRFMYCNVKGSRILIQAGSCNGVDSALIWVNDLSIYTIEFKERSAKTGEHDLLPLYGEDGILKIGSLFLKRNPQFELMLEEKKGLNFFENIGNNVNDFSPKSVKYSITNSYVKKYADVICTEDDENYLIMFPANQIEEFAVLQGEIRPAGRNHCKVFTPIALHKFLLEKDAVLQEGIVTMQKEKLHTVSARGGDGSINRYKINSLFFVYANKCSIDGECVTFQLKDIKQLKPTIASKMYLKKEAQYDYFKSLFLGKVERDG